MCPPGAAERVDLRATPRVALGPARLDPSLLLEPMQRRIQRSLLHLQHLARHLLDTLGYRPPVRGLERQCLENQKIQGSLDEVGGFTHMPRRSTTGGLGL